MLKYHITLAAECTGRPQMLPQTRTPSIKLLIQRGRHPSFLEDVEPLRTLSHTESCLSIPSTRGQMTHADGKSCQSKRTRGGSSPAFEPTTFTQRTATVHLYANPHVVLHLKPFLPWSQGHSAPSSYSSWIHMWRSAVMPKSCTSLISIAANLLPAAPPHRPSRQAQERSYLSPPCSGAARDIDVGFPCHVLANGA